MQQACIVEDTCACSKDLWRLNKWALKSFVWVGINLHKENAIPGIKVPIFFLQRSALHPFTPNKGQTSESQFHASLLLCSQICLSLLLYSIDLPFNHLLLPMLFNLCLPPCILTHTSPVSQIHCEFMILLYLPF